MSSTSIEAADQVSPQACPLRSARRLLNPQQRIGNCHRRYFLPQLPQAGMISRVTGVARDAGPCHAICRGRRTINGYPAKKDHMAVQQIDYASGVGAGRSRFALITLVLMAIAAAGLAVAFLDGTNNTNIIGMGSLPVAAV